MDHTLFQNKLVLAPMVRVSKLPMRLLALDYGADLVYCEEVVDFKMLQSRKVENKLLGTTDFLLSDDSVTFRTCPREKKNLVFQMGTSNAQRAVKVAKMVEPYVAAIDINMGCPKEFSTKEGMGAALLDHPETYTEILTSLVRSLSIPVTCKIRIKPKLADTLDLVRRIEGTGVSGIAVHGRTREERPKDDNHDDVIAEIVRNTRLPVIANGGSSRIRTHADIGAFKASTQASSVMIARTAMHNPSIFLPQPLPIDTVINHFLHYALEFDSHPMHVKYVVQQLINDQLTTPLGQAFLQSKTLLDICSLWGFEKHYKELEDGRVARSKDGGNDGEDEDEDGGEKRVEEGVVYKVVVMEDGSEVFLMDYKYDRKDTDLLNKSKMQLYNWTVRNKLKAPTYQSTLHPTERSYRSVVTVNHLKFTTSVWNKSDKLSQRSAAHVCLCLLSLPSISPRILSRNNNNNININSNSNKDEENNRAIIDINGANKVVSNGGNGVNEGDYKVDGKVDDSNGDLFVELANNCDKSTANEHRLINNKNNIINNGISTGVILGNNNNSNNNHIDSKSIDEGNVKYNDGGLAGGCNSGDGAGVKRSKHEGIGVKKIKL